MCGLRTGSAIYALVICLEIAKKMGPESTPADFRLWQTIILAYAEDDRDSKERWIGWMRNCACP
jgi:hypothetical protein